MRSSSGGWRVYARWALCSAGYGIFRFRPKRTTPCLGSAAVGRSHSPASAGLRCGLILFRVLARCRNPSPWGVSRRRGLRPRLTAASDVAFRRVSRLILSVAEKDDCRDPRGGRSRRPNVRTASPNRRSAVIRRRRLFAGFFRSRRFYGGPLS